ncbi:MAG: S-methyl-5-thioribose-1-phosphate isomerase [Oscillospiraceae bacterium]|nr:S-methyl-5-thioribose-1-phosphate isomerase [Oscillospiraceae bacterium]
MQDPVSFDVERNRLVIIDQTRLPGELKLLSLHSIEEMETAIRTLQVRGAPAIGVAAAIGLAVLARALGTDDGYSSKLHQYADRLRATRPTAVNLAWALERMLAGPHDPESLAREALAIWSEDIETCRKIGEHGGALLHDGDHVLTHCNAGRLATVRYGTALAPVYIAQEQGKRIHVYADETRPLLQGARLTAYELTEAGVPVTLLCDNMAAGLLSAGAIDAIFIGADRIARNGDTANKTGSLGLSIMARYYDVPFYVCAPFSTIDFSCAEGGEIPIEQRAPEEVTQTWYEERMAPQGIEVYNPAFDIVPNENIAAFVTERGVIPARDLSKQSSCVS